MNCSVAVSLATPAAIGVLACSPLLPGPLSPSVAIAKVPLPTVRKPVQVFCVPERVQRPLSTLVTFMTFPLSLINPVIKPGATPPRYKVRPEVVCDRAGHSQRPTIALDNGRAVRRYKGNRAVRLLLPWTF